MSANDERHDSRYQARGVSASKAEVHAAIRHQDQGLYPGAFCKIIPDLLGNDPQHCLVVHADGAGTKSSLAYIAWREGFGTAVWNGIAQDSLVMNLDDCACVGALGPFLISNTIGRNAKRIPGEVIAAIVNGYQHVCDQLQGLGIPCIMTGGETADVGDLVRTVIVDSTITVRVPRNQVIDAARMIPGDVIVGFSSIGQATWESTPNSGMGSNGLSSARHDLLHPDYRTKYPESFAPEIDQTLVYCGPHHLSDPLPGAANMSVGAALLSPTRTYVPLIKKILTTIPLSDVHGLIHCSGGGQSKIVRFGGGHQGRGNRYVKDACFPVPPLFAAIQAATELSWAEMYSVYNMGHRLEAIVPAHAAQACLDIAAACHIDAKIVGRVEAADGAANEVIVRSPFGEFTYR